MDRDNNTDVRLDTLEQELARLTRRVATLEETTAQLMRELRDVLEQEELDARP